MLPALERGRKLFLRFPNCLGASRAWGSGMRGIEHMGWPAFRGPAGRWPGPPFIGSGGRSGC
eukprot:8725256-Alexandrium_andersonii.AAC.1